MLNMLADHFCIPDGSMIGHDEMKDGDLIHDSWAIDVESFEADNHTTTIRHVPNPNSANSIRLSWTLI